MLGSSLDSAARRLFQASQAFEKASGLNRKRAGEITYIWTSKGWLYLAVILDLHSWRVVGWAVSDRMKKNLAIRALDMAVYHPACSGVSANVVIPCRGGGHPLAPARNF